MIEKNDPDYIFDEYKNYLIASHKNNVPQKSIDNVIIVYDKLDFPDYGFYIGLDDSKCSGHREMDPVNIDDARDYIDWLSEVINKRGRRQDENASDPVLIKEVVGKILAKVTAKKLENKEEQSAPIGKWKGRRI